MTDRRVAITGIGIVSPIGIGHETYWENLLAGRSGIGPVESFDPAGLDCRIAGEIKDFSARKFVPKSYRKAVKVMARDIELAVAAADGAFIDSGLITRTEEDKPLTVPARRMGCNIGAGLITADLDELSAATMASLDDQGKFDIRKWGKDGLANLTPLWLLKYLPNMLACHVTIIHGCEGPSNNITCGCASGHLSVAEAAQWIRRGEADVVIAGGAESKLVPLGMVRQQMLGRLTTAGNDTPGQAVRPFDKDHSGTVVGEGGALMILEDLDHARTRGAKIYAEVIGHAAACDPRGVDIAGGHAYGIAPAVRNALTAAGVKPLEVDFFVTHGTGVAAEDRCEARAWNEALGDDLDDATGTCITAQVGSLFAGSGALEIATAALALHDETIPPAMNYETPDPHCHLPMHAQPVSRASRYAVTASFSVGGQAAACVLKRYEND